ncbi:MAG: flagellar hook capping protein [Deltaproteobacteria bacterium]|nr:MAG: flagellar hook capping protein [Deltaproteobacteria bacterium]
MNTIQDLSSLPSLEQLKQVSEQVEKKGERSTVSKDEFLTLLIAQLKNQDPLNPLKDTEFLSQLATFTTLEQITNMGDMVSEMMATQKYLNSAIAAGLIGRVVTTSAGEEGVVTGVAMSDQGIFLDVNGDAIPLSDVRVIQGGSVQA